MMNLIMNNIEIFVFLIPGVLMFIMGWILYKVFSFPTKETKKK
ncbi:hypothetical protein SAMN05421743_12158 [Thalassobacillus cyri]|uniref:Uncharacterized protein n=1 Tax=Thalassobacillus cyri TaxID=571932 RepID=A0A1H4H219_9BACI|nr:hypothetical protein SAMN05421743_12158 [Thalassobacillus cyri]